MARALPLLLLWAACGGSPATTIPDLAVEAPDLAAAGDMGPSPRTHVIVVVWSGLRNDPIDAKVTPNLAVVASAGALFTDHHASWPPETMTNAAGLATGAFPSENGIGAGTVYAPTASGANARGKAADFVDPIATGDWAVLQDLDQAFAGLLLDNTLFKAAHAKGVPLAALGQSGPAFLQDVPRQGFIADENMVWPSMAVQDLLGLGLPLPANTPNAYPAGSLSLPSDNGSPTGFAPLVLLADGVTPDPAAAVQSRSTSSTAYLMSLYLTYVLPHLDPRLTVFWMRNPDGGERDYGPGTTAAKEALHADDAALGMLLEGLKEAGLGGHYDLIVASDHGHSTVSGPPALFPPRAITAGATGSPSANGWSASGQVRLAELLSASTQFPDVYDGLGCVDAPVLSGLLTDGSPLHPEQSDTTGTVCGTAGTSYTSKSYKITGLLPSDAIVVAPNGGSDWIYVPSGSATLVGNLVTFLQSREEVGAIFVAGKYGALPGTLPLSSIRAELPAGRSPDLLVGFSWGEDLVQGLAGIEMADSGNDRGSAGAFSPHDAHGVMVAFGPDFLPGFMDTLPSGTVDVAPTVAKILGLSLPSADGRTLDEALAGGAMMSDYVVAPKTTNSAAATGLSFVLPTGAPDPSAPTGSYSIELQAKTLARGASSWTYFDQAKAIRK